MTIAEVRQELMNHLVVLKIPRTIEPNPNPNIPSVYCVSPYYWEVEPENGVRLFKMWLDRLARGTDFLDYHTLKVELDAFLGAKVTLSQGA